MKNHHVLLNLLATGLVVSALIAPALAAPEIFGTSLSTTDAPGETVDPISQAEIARRLAAVAAERAASSPQVAPGNSRAGAHAATMAEKLEQIEQQLKAQTDLAETLALPPPTSSEPLPVDKPSAYRLNALYEQLATADSAQREKRSNLSTATEQLQTLEARAREARATLPETPGDNRTRAEHAAQLAELNARLLREQVNLARLELRAAQQQAARSGSLEARITALRGSLARGEGDPDSLTPALLERESALQRARSKAERLLATGELRLAAAKQRYANNPQTSAGMLEVVEALTIYREIMGKRISLATTDLEGLARLREVWRNWDAVLRSNATEEDLESWEPSARDLVSDLKLTTSLRRGQLTDLQIRRDNLQARVNQLAGESPARAAWQEAVEALTSLNTDLLASERQLAADQRVAERFLNDIQAVTGNVGVFEYLNRGVQFLRQLWTYEITTIDAAPFTVGSLTMGLLLFGIGLWASRLGASMVGRLATRRLKLDAGAAQAIQTFSFYALLAGFTLLALRTVHFPLTAFAFLGGALAIGIGFGSQNVMNNFISGLILMLERPVRAQDVVEVDGSHGVIQKIGPRSTQIRSTDGRHIVVPNSFFLESNVINWTLSDELMRTRVSVGVVYGSPTRLVKQLIEDVLREEPLALDTPAPNIIFDAFGDNSLNFDAYFWVTARSPMSVREVQSRVRFRIDDVFREHDLVIAFPQRDVHLDSLSPIEVRMVGAPDAPDAPAADQDPTTKTS